MCVRVPQPNRDCDLRSIHHPYGTDPLHADRLCPQETTNRNTEHSLQQPPLTPFETSGFCTSLTIEEDLWTIDGTGVVIFLEHEKWKSGNQYHVGGSNNRGLGHLMDIQWEEGLFAWQDQWFKWSSSSRSATDQIIPICFVTATLPCWTVLVCVRPIYFWVGTSDIIRDEDHKLAWASEVQQVYQEEW